MKPAHLLTEALRDNPDLAAAMLAGVPIDYESQERDGRFIVTLRTRYPVAVHRDEQGRVLRVSYRTEGAAA